MPRRDSKYDSKIPVYDDAERSRRKQILGLEEKLKRPVRPGLLHFVIPPGYYDRYVVQMDDWQRIFRQLMEPPTPEEVNGPGPW